MPPLIRKAKEPLGNRIRDSLLYPGTGLVAVGEFMTLPRLTRYCFEVLSPQAMVGRTDTLLHAREFCYLPMQNELKIRPSKSSLVKAPVISPSASWARRRSSASSSPA